MKTPDLSDHLAHIAEAKRLEIVTRGAVDTLLQGSYRSTFRGRGLEFHQVREYTPEDDTRTIDWNVTARLNAPFIKQFTEERELHLVLAVDLSASIGHGTGPASKRETVMRLCSALAFAAARQQDRVGLMVFTDRVEYFLPPRKGRGAALRVVRDLSSFVPVGRRTDFKPALRTLASALRRRSVLFLVSDFTDAFAPEDAAILARRHDLIAAVIRDPLEDLPEVSARLAVRDPETGRTAVISRGAHSAVLRAAEARETQLKELVAKGADRLDVTAGAELLPLLMRFFRRRIDRMARR
jgi:uncharacterized protein (DUF58 family)